MSPMVALYTWPLISLAILKRLRLPLAILVVVIAGNMFLPVRYAIDFPMVPPLDKHVIPALTVLVATLLITSLGAGVQQQPGLIPKSLTAKLLIAMLLFGSLGTVLTNGDRIVTPLEVKNGLTIYDALSSAVALGLLLVPALLGRKYFANPETHRLILIVLVIAACGYAFLALFEIRMSPRLNRMLYGFTPHDWRQHIRGSGFRPMVFMEHGLRVALFFALALIAAVGLFRCGWRIGWMILAVAWLFITLVLSKSLGALTIALIIIPIIFFLNTRLLILVAALIGGIVMTYPMLRGASVVPVDKVISLASSVDSVRAASLEFRLENEDLLLDRANERPLFGWGGFGRSFVRNEKGIDISVPDGYWVIIIGKGGWTQYIGQFGFMAMPMLFLFFYRQRMNISRETAVLSILLAGNMIDLIPNSGQTPLTWLIAGALWGRLEFDNGLQEAPLDDDISSTEDRTSPQYARDFGKSPVRQRQTLQRASTRVSKRLY